MPTRIYATYAELLAHTRIYGVRHRKRLAEASGSHTKRDLDAIRQRQGDKCVYCPTPLNGKGCRDHIVALVRGGSNDPSNLQWLCTRCSCFKGSKSEAEFLDVMNALKSIGKWR